MNETLVFKSFLMPVGWIAISTRRISMRAQDRQKALRTILVERYIPLH